MDSVWQEREIPTPMTWLTGADSMTTKTNCRIKFKLDDFSASKEVTWTFHVDETKISDKLLGYDMIMGLDIMTGLGIIINRKDKTIKLAEAKISMASNANLSRKQLKNVLLSIEEPESNTSEESRPFQNG